MAAAALLAALALLLAAAPASAHAELVSSDPADGAVLPQAPDQVTLTFSEPVRLTDQEITVYDAEGKQVASEASASGDEVTVALSEAADMGRGSYVVGWYVLSADGHPVSGSLTFSVGEASETVAAPPPAPKSSVVVTTAQGLAVALTYLGLLVAAGLAVFSALLLPATYDGQRLWRRIRNLARAAAALATLGALLQVPLASAYAQGLGPAGVLGGFDPALARHEVMAAALVVAGLVVVVTSLDDEPPTAGGRVALVAGAGLALLAPAVVGHTRSNEPTWLVVVSDVIHVSAGAVWLGGLVGLALSLRRLAVRDRATTLARFSTLAGGLLLAVAAAGTVLAWRILGSWSGFVDTGYGRLLLVKIGLALVAAGIGAWNRFGMLPRVRTAIGLREAGRAAALVTRTVTVEALVIVALLGVTGFLVNQSPRPEPAAATAAGVPAPQTRSAQAGDLTVYVELSPAVRGSNTLQVHLHRADGALVTTRRPPVVSVRTSGLDLGEVPVAETADGSYDAEVLLPQAGTWEVQVSARLSRFENPVTTVRFDVTDPGSR